MPSLLPSPPSWLSALGAGLALYLTYNVLDFIWLYAVPVPRHRGLSRYLHASPAGQPPWALVTGASDGIGRALAAELAAAGFNVVLHGRDPAKLERVRAALAAAHPARSFRLLVADASSPSLYQHPETDTDPGTPLEALLLPPLADLHLTVLINNAGAGPHPTFGPLHAYPGPEILRVLRLNAAFPALLAAALIPRLRRPALLLNVASVTDEGLPLLSFYGAAKAASHVLHVALAREAAAATAAAAGGGGGGGGGGDGDGGLEVASHRVGAVTGVSRVREPPSLLRPDAAVIARAVLARVGCGRGAVVPYWPHAVQQLGMGLLPRWVRERIVMRVMRELSEKQEGRGKSG